MNCDNDNGIGARHKRTAATAEINENPINKKKIWEYAEKGRDFVLAKLHIKYPLREISSDDIHFDKIKSKRTQQIPDYPHSKNRNSEPTYGEGYLFSYRYEVDSDSETIGLYAHTDGELRFNLVDPNLEKLEKLPKNLLEKVLEYLDTDIDQDFSVTILSNHTELHHAVQMQNSLRKRDLEFYHITLQVGDDNYQVEIDADGTMIHVIHDSEEDVFYSLGETSERNRKSDKHYNFLNKAPQCPMQIFRQCSWYLIKELQKVYPGRTIKEGEIQLAEYTEVDLKISELNKKAQFEQFKIPGYHLYLTYNDKDYTVNTDEYCHYRFCPTITLCRLPKHIYQIMIEQANENLKPDIDPADITILCAEKTVWKNQSLETKQGLSKPTYESVAGYTIEYEVSLFKCFLKVNLQGTNLRFRFESSSPEVDSE